jgi:hypothetical protein
MCSKTILQEDNQDVIQSPRDVDSGSELEISTSTNFSLSTQTEIAHDIAGENVDEWFKQRTESVSSIDLDAVMKTEGMDTAYLTETIGHNFLSNKDVDMTCIVTNICDMGLGLDIPTNSSSSSKSKPVTETDCDNVILSNYSSDQETLLNDLNRSDLLDKDILVGNSGINSLHKVNLLDAVKQNHSADHVIEPIEEEYTSLEDPSSTKQKNGFKESLWTGSEITDTQPSIETVKEKANWESLSATSKRSVDGDSEKEIDFPELNLITFQIDPNDAMCSINQVPHVEINHKDILVSSTIDDSNKDILNIKKDIPSAPIDLSRKKQPVILTESGNPLKSVPSTSTISLPVSKSTVLPTLNPRSLLKSPLKISNVSKKSSILKSAAGPSGSASQSKSTAVGGTHVDTPQEVSKVAASPKKPSSMAIIAISTDKSKNTTEIVINTPYGEQVFKGKTTDLMRATSGLWQKLDNNKIQKAEQPLTISMMNGTAEQSSALDVSHGDQTTPLTTVIPGDLGEEGEEYSELTTEEDRPVAEALAEFGIAVDKDNIFCVTTGNGQKLWVCPVKDCDRMYPRQSMLKVHILSHFNVRPFRCNFAGCHWSFYTYFKLKRHKETHLKRKDFVCPIRGCGRRFTTIYNLNTHQKLHARPLEMVCPVEMCAARFQTKRSLELHLKSHDSYHAPYRCLYEGCGKHYYSLNSLNSHSRSHQHKEEEVRCQWEGCGKLFDKPCRLKAHMRSHTGDKPYSCLYPDCGWSFSSASKLKRHQQKHTNERKFQCSVEGCGKSFMRSEHLKEHKLTHVGQRNFKCPYDYCGVKFSAKSSLYVHLKKHSKPKSATGDKVVYHCPIEKCTRTYTCKSSLRQHMLKFHTPVLANDPSQLDYIALLTGDDDLATLEGLQFSGDMTPSVNGSISSLNSINLITPPSMMINGSDGIGSIPPEFISTDFQLPGIMPSKICASGSSGIGPSSGTSSSVVTHVVLAPSDTQNSTLAMSNQPDIGDATDQPVSMPMFEPVALEVDNRPSSEHGCARTSFTYQDIVQDRERRRGNASPSSVDPSSSTTTGLRVPTDVVLGTGLLGSSQDIAHSFLLQDDLPSHHHSLYQEDNMMAVGPGVGEFQVLLLDSTSSTRHEFAESTINLRDLE